MIEYVAIYQSKAAECFVVFNVALVLTMFFDVDNLLIKVISRCWCKSNSWIGEPPNTRSRLGMLIPRPNKHGLSL